MTADTVVVQITLLEEYHLARIVDDFIELVRDSEGEADPAVERLAPIPYPDDTAAADEFARATRSDLLERRLVDARVVRDALDSDAEIEALSEAEALATRDVTLATSTLDSWLRTLTAIRLVIASRLGITSDEEASEDARHEVYDWIGYRLELIVEAADAADARRGED
jgi:hypothetical protein